jgi:hypothetical protein
MKPTNLSEFVIIFVTLTKFKKILWEKDKTQRKMLKKHLLNQQKKKKQKRG